MTRTCFRFVALMALAFSMPCPAATLVPHDGSGFEAAMAAMCSKRVVILGEDAGHGAGATVALKGRIVEALVDQCGFDTLYFEAPVYEFLDLEERLARGDAQPAHLTDAIGPMWAGTREFEPTLRWLWHRIRAGTLRVRGLDMQMGGVSQHFSERELPGRLAAHAGSERGTCEASLARLTRWDFTASHPYDETFRRTLRGCLSGIERTLTTSDDAADRFSYRMAVNLTQFLAMSDGDSFNVRDAAMAQNFAWHHGRTPAERAILWTTTSHAVKGALPDRPDRVPLGMHLSSRWGASLASIGFSAQSGHYGRPGRQSSEVAHVTASLERRHDTATFVDSADLRRIGPITSPVVAYARPFLADWSTLLDGIWVLPMETPLHVREIAETASPPLSPHL